MSNATRLSPLDHPTGLPPQRTFHLDGRTLLDPCPDGTATAGPGLAAGFSRRRARRVTRWRQLDGTEQQLLVVAVREYTLDHATDPSAGPSGDIAASRGAGQRLLQLGLIGFYEVTDGYPDLTGAKLDLVLREDSWWDSTNDASRRVGVYLTTSGEDLVLRLWRTDEGGFATKQQSRSRH